MVNGSASVRMFLKRSLQGRYRSYRHHDPSDSSRIIHHLASVCISLNVSKRGLTGSSEMGGAFVVVVVIPAAVILSLSL